MENKDLVMLAVDSIRGSVAGNYSNAQVGETIRQEIISLNGGTKFDPRKFRPGTELFDLIETLIPVIRNERFDENNAVMQFVERRDISAGDLNEFYTEGEANFIVAEAAGGILSARRQRILDGEKMIVPTTAKYVRVYEPIERLMAGRISWEKFVQGVADAENRNIFGSYYAALRDIDANKAGFDDRFSTTGSYDEDELVEKCVALSAATGGKGVKILGSLLALRKIKREGVGEAGAQSKYNVGYYDRLGDFPMIKLDQVFIPGTTDYAIRNDVVYLIAAEDKFIKHVVEGDSYLDQRTFGANHDMTQEYIHIYRDGVGVIHAAPIGVCNVA